MKYGIIPVSIISLGLLSGCGSGLSKLTDEQKATVKSSMNNAERSFQATSKVRGGGNKKISSRFFKYTPFATVETSVSPPSDQTVTMENKLQQGLTSGQCEAKTNGSGQDPLSSYGLAEVELTGASCPIYLKMGGEMGKDKISFHLEYKAQDEEFKKLSDISAATFNGSVAQKDKNSVSVSCDGSLSSVKIGDIKFSCEGSGKNDSGEFKLRLDYPKFSAEFKVEGDSKKVKYFLNGEELTEKQMREYISTLPAVGGGAEPEKA